MKSIQNTTQTLVVDQRVSRKVFPLEDILSVATGLLLSSEGASAVHDLVGFLAEGESGAGNTAENIDRAKICLEEQLPFLRHLDLRELHAHVRASPGKIDGHVSAWAEKQRHLYGVEHQLFSISRWQRAKNNYKL